MELLKQSNRSPLSLIRQVGILSLANQKLLLALEIKSVRSFISFYLDVPAWVLLLIPPHLLGISIWSCVFRT